MSLETFLKLFAIITTALALSSCEFEPGKSPPKPSHLFTEMLSTETGITFNNEVVEDLKGNFMTYEGYYQGAGVGVGDVNNDGLADIYFAGNMVKNKLYLNKGNFQFEDITQQAGVDGGEGWSTGVSMADVNNDGLLDIYVCKYLWVDEDELRKNILYINNGDLSFSEKGEQFGVADKGFSIHSAFLDFDRDGDLDLYVVNQPPSYMEIRRKMKGVINYKFSDNFYENVGGKFKLKTIEAGLKNYSFGLSATVGDLNNDNWPDIYVASDYEEPDFLYINNRDGTFSNKIDEYLRHISNFGMGADIADINNDGYLDIYVADMVAKDNARIKTNMSGMNPEKFWGLANNGYHFQYMFNSLQLNQGNGKFSEIAQLAGVSNTDWSWTSLFADFDNDGFKDLIVTNGLKRDVRDNDFQINKKKFVEKRKAEEAAKGNPPPKFDPLEILDLAPSTLLHNYIFKNRGDLTFQNVVKEWGMEQKMITQGAAYADFDNDGDLDIVGNNMNKKAIIYRNNATDITGNNFISLKLSADSKGAAHGAKITLFIDNQIQFLELTTARGYMSCSDDIIHFGIGDSEKIDRIEIAWLDDRITTIENPKPNRLLRISQKDAKPGKSAFPKKPDSLIFEELSGANTIDFKHRENNYDDFKDEILIPHRMSRLGSKMAAGDVNGDGLDDFFIGGALDQSGCLFLQDENSNFNKAKLQPWTAHQLSEDIDALFFDPDSDGDLDLYVVSGGNEHDAGSKHYQDRLYENDGNGNFVFNESALPQITGSGGCAVAGDYDMDGDLDLFIGGRQKPKHYPFPGRSYILKNDKGKFEDVTNSTAPEITEIGMVTCAVWTDFENDNDLDLLIAGEWMDITLIQNLGDRFEKMDSTPGLEHTAGWWNAITEADFDKDGDMDYVLGNLGLNIKYKASEQEPFQVYCHDFDGNGSLDIYLGYYNDGICYPVRGRQCSSQQMPFIKKKFPSYNAFSQASILDVLGDEAGEALHLEAFRFESSLMENLGKGSFKMHSLPNEAQLSTVSGIVIEDFNGDEQLDILLAGNFYEREVETTRSDASVGLLLKGDGKGAFIPVPPVESGFYAFKDARDLKLLKTASPKKPLIIVSNNNDVLQIFRKN